MDNSEYLETKQDTMEQMRELNESLERLSSGNLSLISTFSAMRLVCSPSHKLYNYTKLNEFYLNFTILGFMCSNIRSI